MMHVPWLHGRLCICDIDGAQGTVVSIHQYVLLRQIRHCEELISITLSLMSSSSVTAYASTPCFDVGLALSM